MKFEHVLQLIREVSHAGLTAFRYQDEQVEICMEAKHHSNEQSNTTPYTEQNTIREVSTEQIAYQNHRTKQEEQIEEKVEEKIGGNTVTSPLVGTFYSAPSEDSEPYVKVGDSIKKGQVLAIVEAMKLMNEIESEYDGVVREILVQNGTGIEYGQPLFIIE